MKNKSFWISLLVFILFMCSCKTKKLDSNVQIRNEVQTEVSHLTEKAKVDTTKTKKIEEIDEYIRITEEEIIVEYDTEKETVSKVTKKEKVTEQASKTKTDESQDRGMTSMRKDSIDHSLDSTKNVDANEEIKEESAVKGFFDEFGKWLGIGIAVIIFVYLLRKFVHNRLTSQS